MRAVSGPNEISQDVNYKVYKAVHFSTSSLLIHGAECSTCFDLLKSIRIYFELLVLLWQYHLQFYNGVSGVDRRPLISKERVAEETELGSLWCPGAQIRVHYVWSPILCDLFLRKPNIHVQSELPKPKLLRFFAQGLKQGTSWTGCRSITGPTLGQTHVQTGSYCDFRITK